MPGQAAEGRKMSTAAQHEVGVGVGADNVIANTCVPLGLSKREGVGCYELPRVRIERPHGAELLRIDVDDGRVRDASIRDVDRVVDAQKRGAKEDEHAISSSENFGRVRNGAVLQLVDSDRRTRLNSLEEGLERLARGCAREEAPVRAGDKPVPGETRYQGS